MSHEIYYTSAPEGIKRGASGFCTVAATEGIPRALWDRLEALSAYRHHVSSASEAGAHHAGRNPVSFAHWTLAVAGTTYRVLSRICDSGVDHTQRTNAFAHHLVVEPNDMAPAGPAWMLDQPGVMVSSWNGSVGTLPTGRSLPSSDESPAPARTWEQLTGDAGWAGVLAESAMRSPPKPVCILFNEDQDPLPLIAEALRLLPPHKRWDVTFNTYFTSMPTSASCLWRCCLKGTPAADVGLRYASNGLVLDLTSPLGAPPESDLVETARTGIASVTSRLRTATAAAARNNLRPAPVAAASTTSAPPPPTQPPAQRNFNTNGTPPEPSLPPIVADFPPQSPSPSSDPRSPAIPTFSGRRLTDVMHDADEQLSATREAEKNALKKRRTQILLLYVGAVAAIAVGMFLVWVAYRNAAPPDAVPVHNSNNPDVIEPQPDTQIAVVKIPDPIPNKLPDVTIPEKQPDPIPDTTATTVAPLPPPDNTVKIPTAPKIITLKNALERVTSGSGLADKKQSINIPAADFADSKAITALSLNFPNNKNEYTYKYESLNGSLISEPYTRNGSLGFTLRWKDAGDNSVADIVTIALPKNRTPLELTWKTGLAVKRPELMTFVYWFLHNTSLSADMPKSAGGSQRIEFKPVEPKTLSLKDPSSTFSFPAELPRETTITPGPLPLGWTAQWYTDWEVKDASLRTPENASQVLKFRKPTSSAAVDSMFLLSFRPGFKSVDSDFTKRLATAELDLAKFESDLRAINTEIQTIKRDFNKTDPLLEGKKLEAETLVTTFKAAVAAYKEIDSLEISLNLPDGLKIASLNFKREGK